jgi:hypothetical protein
MASTRSMNKAEFNLIKEHKAWNEDDWDHQEFLDYSEAPTPSKNPFFIVLGKEAVNTLVE